MNALLNLWGNWSAWPSSANLAAALTQNGLVLLLQTSLLLIPGSWVLKHLEKRNLALRSLLGRSLLLSVLAGVLLSTGLLLGGRGSLPVVWNLAWPVASTSPAMAPDASFPPEAGVTAGTSAREERIPKHPAAVAVANDAVGMSPSPQANEALAPSTGRKAAPDALETTGTATVWQGLIIGLAGCLWLGGTIALLLWLGVCHIALWRLRRSAQLVQDGEVLNLLKEVCVAQNVPMPRLLRHQGVTSPFMTGLLRPAIVLPASDALLSDEALRLILVHELNHLKRRDLWWNTLGRIGCALLWPHPFLWWLCRNLEQINEESCDEAVLGAGCQRHLYARCLLEWAQSLTSKRAERVAGAGVMTGRSSLARRIQAILDDSQPKNQPISRRMRWTLTGGALSAIIAMPLVVSSDPTPRAQSRVDSPVTAGEKRRQPLQHFKKTQNYEISIGGVSNGILQGVFIRRLQGKDISQLLFARNVRRGTRHKNKLSPWWVLGDAVVYNFRADLGLVSEARIKEMTIEQPEFSDFLEQQSKAAPQPMSASDWRALQSIMTLPAGELAALQKWSGSQPKASITGRVINEEGQPVSGANVSVRLSYDTLHRAVKVADSRKYMLLQYLFALPKTARDRIVRNVVTGADGSYRITGLMGATYGLGTDGYQRSTRSETTLKLPDKIIWQNLKVTARAGQTVSAPDIQLTRGGLVQVRVVDKDTGTPLPEVTIFGSSLADKVSHETYRVDTDTKGESPFRLPPGWANIALGGQHLAKPHAFVVNSKGVFYSAQRGMVSLDGGTPARFTGRTEVDIIKGRTREVLLQLPRYVAPTPTPTPPRLPPPPGTAALTGRVVDEKGQPVVGVTVAAEMQQKARWVLMRGAGLAYSNGDTPNFKQKWASIEGALYQRAVSRRDGSFRLEGLTTAPYNLVIVSSKPYSRDSFGMQMPEDWVATAVEGAWAKEGQVTRRPQPIVLTRGALIRGRVVDKATGLPLGGVVFGSNGPHLPASTDSVVGAKSDAQGRFNLRVAPGTTTLYIAGPNVGGSYIFADNRQSANVYSIGTHRATYAGSKGVQYELDGGAPQFGLDGVRGPKGYIQIESRSGQVRELTLRLRRIIPQKENSRR